VRRVFRRALGIAAAGALVARAAPEQGAHAAGTALDVQSARDTAMAGAVTASIDDSSAIFYNPAGIAQGRKIDVEVGDTVIMPTFRFRDVSGVSTQTDFHASPPFQLYESGGVTDRISIGVGVFTPFGLTIPWPSNWEGNRLVTRSTLATYDFNPTVAYRFGALRVGAGAQLVRATVDLQKKIETGVAEADVELGAATWGFGGNVGAELEAIPQYLSLGVHYRSAVTLAFTGEAHFDDVPPPFQSLLRDQYVKTTLVDPDTFQMGVASRPIQSLLIEADVVWYGWAKFRAISIAFPADASGQLGASTSEPKNWHDTVNGHLGGELSIDRHWQVRAGFEFDPSPSPASTLLPDVPDADRLNVAGGAGYLDSSGFGLDLGYQHIFAFTKTSTAPSLPGTYGGSAEIVGLSLIYKTPK
jgi:long-chain fatty acid transport protein